MSALKVLVVTNMYPTTEAPWAGVFVAEQVEDLRALGLDIDVFSFDGRVDWKEYSARGALAATSRGRERLGPRPCALRADRRSRVDAAPHTGAYHLLGQ